jgi:hypothetical protein
MHQNSIYAFFCIHASGLFFLSKPGQEKTEADPLYQIEHALNRKPLNRSIANRSIAQSLKKTLSKLPEHARGMHQGFAKGLDRVGLKLKAQSLKLKLRHWLRLSEQSVFCHALSKSVFSNECFLG